jgi:drug/metabolite transporter (DMT)-like permease
VVFANETLNIWMVISAAIIIGSVIIINYARYSSRQPAKPLPVSSSDD